MAVLDYKKILVKKEFLPFYVYDYEIIERQILKLKKNLPLNVKIYYSVKANPNIAILRIMKNFGLGAEIVSWGEFLAAKEAGFKPEDILFAGSLKSDEELFLAAKESVSLISLESLAELRRLSRIAGKLRKRQNIIIRLSLDLRRKDAREDSFKSVIDFGISLDDFEKNIRNFRIRFPFLDLKGLHIYGASRIFNPDYCIKMAEKFFSLIHRLEEEFGFCFDVINIGGGFGADAKNEFPVATFSEELSKLLTIHSLSKRKIILELGRYLVNQAGSYVFRILEVTNKSGVYFLISEGGIMNHLIKRGYKILSFDYESSQKMNDGAGNYGIKLLPLRKGRPLFCVICGQLSSMGDTFGGTMGRDWQFSLPRPKVGDFVVLKNVGAYGLTQAQSAFGSRSIAAEFLLINGKLELIRDKGKPEDFLLHQKIPSFLK